MTLNEKSFRRMTKAQQNKVGNLNRRRRNFELEKSTVKNFYTEHGAYGAPLPRKGIKNEDM